MEVKNVINSYTSWHGFDVNLFIVLSHIEFYWSGSDFIIVQIWLVAIKCFTWIILRLIILFFSISLLVLCKFSLHRTPICNVVVTNICKPRLAINYLIRHKNYDVWQLFILWFIELWYLIRHILWAYYRATALSITWEILYELERDE